MPEGDTVHTVARVMAPDLVGVPLARVALDKLPQRWGAGAVATACRALGKHLVIDLDTPLGPRVLRVHLGMKGSWHRYRPGEAWRRPVAGARVQLDTASWVFVCFGPKEVEVLTRGAPRPVAAGHLGPDLLAEVFDLAEALRRARAPEQADAAIADLLLTQTVAAGIGNIYKSESLFRERTNPFLRVGDLDDARIGAVYLRARELMQASVAHAGGIRRAFRLAVYRRRGRPCPVCATPIARALQGSMARSTYWCPTCQPGPSR